MNWNGQTFYAFPPFNLLPRCLQKFSQDRAQVVPIAPPRPTWTWFPVFLRHLCYQPWILLPRPDLPLQLPSPSGRHPLHKNLYLIVGPVSGDLSAITTFQRSPGGSKGTTKQYATYVKNGWHFVVNGKLIVIHHQWEKLFNFSWGYLIKGLATQFLIPLALPYLYHWYDRRGGGKLWFATI